MIVAKDDCVGCPPEIGCLGETCPYKNVPYYYCDNCGDDALYELDGEHYCEQCVNELLDDEYGALSVIEKAERLNINVGKINL